MQRRYGAVQLSLFYKLYDVLIELSTNAFLQTIHKHKIIKLSKFKILLNRMHVIEKISKNNNR